jgi:2-octaprenyl-6-methoxyphenol hydroxylase
MQHEIIIAGDGLSGLTMALALAQSSIPCAIIGPHLKTETSADHAQSDARTTAIMQDGISFLQQLGVWDDIAPHAAPLRHMRLVSGARDIVFSADMIGLPQFGFNIPNAVLKHYLTRHVQRQASIHCISDLIADVVFPHTEARPQNVTLRTEHDVDYTTRLVIAADGAKSLIREQAGIAVTEHDPDQAALVGWVQCDIAHDFTSTEFYYSGGPFTVVPTPDPHVMTLVYCDTAERLAEITALSVDDFNAHLTDMTQNRFGDLHFTGQKQYWPIRSLRAAELIAPHVALIGETAHMMPPLAAQGFNTSLRDIQILHTLLCDARDTGSDMAGMQLLHRYAAARHTDIHARSRAVNGLNDIIRRDDTMGRRLHGWSFAFLDRMIPLKKLVMKVALAPRALHPTTHSITEHA